ncbi:MAG: cobyrinate a,c-diamide synthase [Pseudomonadota bacterium]
MDGMISIPRIAIGALKGGAGKTYISMGIVAALKRRGMRIAVFKKGPDYIDAGWLGLAAGGDCYNLDAYLFDPDTVLSSFVKRSVQADVSVIEGNRGLFDGVDSAGSYSTAELAKMLGAPVVLVIDATKVTRTAAAFVLGCRALDPRLDLRCVILNRVGGKRHERVLREAVEGACGVPVIGAVSKLSLDSFPQRHLGLLPLHEHPKAMALVDQAAQTAEQNIDLDRLLEFIRSAGPLPVPCGADPEPVGRADESNELRIGILRDSAFQFYYPENIEALTNMGASIVRVSALDPKPLPDIHALYIGGGFPETHAERLAENVVFRESLRQAVEDGLPVYAECGGLMYLSRNLIIDHRAYPMTGTFSVDSVLSRVPQGHGYIRAEVVGSNPFYDEGTVLTGHEFHYSYVGGMDDPDVRCVLKVVRGHGIDGFRDGLCKRNALATYVHVHALGEPRWARGIIRTAREYRWRHGS